MKNKIEQNNMYENKKMWLVTTYNKKHYELEICEVFSTKLNAMKFAESVDEKLYDKIFIERIKE